MNFRYLRCKAETTLKSLRLFLEAKIEVTDSYRLHFLDPTCKNVLEEWCTLQDIIAQFTWNRKKPFRLFFTLLVSLFDN